MRRIVQLLGYWRLRRKRLNTFRSAITDVGANKTKAFAWWWDEVNAKGLEAERGDNQEITAWWRGQKAVMEWMLNGCQANQRPYFGEEKRNAGSR